MTFVCKVIVYAPISKSGIHLSASASADPVTLNSHSYGLLLRKRLKVNVGPSEGASGITEGTRQVPGKTSRAAQRGRGSLQPGLQSDIWPGVGRACRFIRWRCWSLETFVFVCLCCCYSVA